MYKTFDMKKIASVIAITTLITTLGANDATAQSKKDKKDSKTDKKEIVKDIPAGKVVAPGTVSKEGFVQMEAGMDYKIVMDVPGDVYPDYGDYLEVHLNTMAGDSVIFDTRTAMDNGQPAPLQLQKSPFRGDLMEALRKMTQGDSAQVRISIDSLLAAGVPEAPWMKKNSNQKLVYNLKVVTVKPAAVKQREDEASASVQIGIDDKLIAEHLAKNKIKATKMPSGLYYNITKEGTGEQAKPGQKVSVNYIGMLLNGEKFDSNVDPQFQHVQAFEFNLGAGNVIKGWDEGISFLKKGGKATLYIPSTLAYGKNSPSPKIPANSVLVFDVELVDIIE